MEVFMENNTKKQLKEQYKNREVIGGVYGVKCEGNGRMWIKSTKNMTGQKNRLAFSIAANSCPEPGMLAEWNQYGAKSFSFVILEQIKKKEVQTEREFSNDIELLLEMWMEKQAGTNDSV
jgi:hypothetical protein